MWSPFYLSVVDNLVNRNGIVNFFHDHLRQAVETKYLPTDDDKRKGYIWLAKFFSSRSVGDRVVSEIICLLSIIHVDRQFFYQLYMSDKS